MSIGLRSLYSQVCRLVEIFCNDNQITDNPPNLPTVSSGQSLLQKVQLCKDFNCQENTKAIHTILMKILSQRIQFTQMIDAFFTGVLEYLSTFSEVKASDALTNKPSRAKVHFRQAYLAFKAFQTPQTLRTALSAYASSAKTLSSPPAAKQIEHLASFILTVFSYA